MAASSSLDRLLDPLTEAFTPKVAAAILELRADSEVEAQIGELRRKANEGIRRNRSISRWNTSFSS
jgi:hypothetical protein